MAMTCMSMTMMTMSSMGVAMMVILLLLLIFYSMSMSVAHNCFIINAFLIKSRIFFRNFIGSLRPFECRARVTMSMSMIMRMAMVMVMSMAMVTRKHLYNIIKWSIFEVICKALTMGMKMRMERMAQQWRAMVAEGATSLKPNCMNSLSRRKTA